MPTETTDLGRPATPEEIRKRGEIPPFVFDAFNRLLARKLQGDKAVIPKADVLQEIARRLPEDRPVELWWLNVEDAYKACGWEAFYEPGNSGIGPPHPPQFLFRAVKQAP